MPNNTTNLFAIVDDAQTPVRRIPLSAELSAELGGFFTGLQTALIDERQEITFAGSYNVDIGEIFTIEGYPLPETIGNAISNPLTCPILNLNEETHRIKALFTGKWADQEQRVSFQLFDSGRLLKRGWALINSGDTYTKLESPGLILQEKLTAFYRNGTLYFCSYHNTKRFLDLSDYYREATNSDLDEFATNEMFEFEDQESFKDSADSIIRKKIALLQKNNVLDNLQVTDIQTVAENFNQSLPEENHITINISEDGKLIIPQDKKKLKELIRFLDEDYVTAPLTKRHCLTNSKTYL